LPCRNKMPSMGEVAALARIMATMQKSNLMICCLVRFFVRRCRSVWLVTAVFSASEACVLIYERRKRRWFGSEAIQSGRTLCL
jgi:hypothetical protein